VHEVIPPAALVGYNNGSAVMTLVLPLGFFIVVMIALYFVFTRPHTVPGHRPISGARPVAPDTAAAPSIAAATGFPLATSTGGTEPLAERGTPPVVGAASADAETAADGAAAGSGTESAAPDSTSAAPGSMTESTDSTGSTDSTEDPE